MHNWKAFQHRLGACQGSCCLPIHRPVFTLAQVAFVQQPQKVDFEVEVMGGSTLSGLIPSLKAWLVGFARDSLISMYVMPEHWTYRIDPVSPT